MPSSPCVLALLTCAVAYGSNTRVQYDAFDTDGNGVIDRDEFINGVASQGAHDTEFEQDDWNEHSQTNNFVETFIGDDTTPDTPQNAMIDGGSSGSKLFTWKSTGEQVDQKIESKCLDRSTHPLKGMSMLNYSPTECRCPDVGGTPTPELALSSSEEMGKFYTKTIAEGITALYRGVGEKKGAHLVPNALPKNAEAVPLLATAGMRLLTQEQNQKVYGELCGKGDNNVKIAPAGPWCRTLPGTMEAFYEWVANAMKARVVEGTFTMGGASAQIAVPLTAADGIKWARLSNEIHRNLDCAKLVLPKADGTVPEANFEGRKCTNCAPLFGKEKGEAVVSGSKKCLTDYIDTIDASQIPEAVRNSDWWPAAPDAIVSVGTISFLGLHGGGPGHLVAGGANEVSAWAATIPECSDPTGTWAACSVKIRDGLHSDPIYKAAMGEKGLKNFATAKHFSYNTPASHPDAQFVEHDDDKNDYATREQGAFSEEVKDVPSPVGQAAKLEELLSANCGHDKGQHYRMAFKTVGSPMGFGGGGDCAKAFWTALYTLDFFSDPTPAGHPGPIDSKQYDWSSGAAPVLPAATTLIQTPLKRHTTTWHQGAMAHYDDVMNQMGGSSLADVSAQSPWMDVLG